MTGKQQVALTQIEIVVLVAVSALLTALVVSGITTHRNKTKRVQCVSRLMQIGASFRGWTSDNADQFPMSASTNSGGKNVVSESHDVFRHCQVLSNELGTPVALTCPADNRLPAESWETLSNTNISYFVGLHLDETQPSAWLAGDRNLEIDGVPAKPGLHVLLPTNVVGWTRELHNRVGNVLFRDGSVQQLSIHRLRRQPETSEVTNRLAIP